MGPKSACSTVLTAQEEAVVVAFRRQAQLPLDDCLYAPLPEALRHQPPAADRQRQAGQAAIQALPDRLLPHRHRRGRTEEGKLHLFGAVDRTSKIAFAQLHKTASVKTAAGFLKALIETIPYQIHTVLTDNGVQFSDMPQHRSGPTARYRLHMFDRICRENCIEHRLTKPNHPWTNRMNRTLKEATVRRYHYDTGRQLEQHLAAFLDAYSFAKRLKTLRGLTPYEHICNVWADQPDRFRYDPTHLTSGLNT
jgi:transposase InsO family protein